MRTLSRNIQRCRRDPGMIHGSCSDYRAAASIDLEHDAADTDKKVTCPTLASGVAMASCTSSSISARLAQAMRARRHRDPARRFSIDQFPDETG